jgi:GNAT superfamily N-acetyltransferase
MLNPAEFSSFETLRDGRRVEIRAQRPDDEEGLRLALGRISDEDYYTRFMGPRREFSEKEAGRFLDVDFVNQVALVVVARQNGAESIVGGGRYFVVGKGSAEVAFAIGDEYQGFGLAGRLLGHLVEIARAARLKIFVAEVLTTNRAMLKVFRRSGLPMTTGFEGATLHLSMKL